MTIEPVGFADGLGDRHGGKTRVKDDSEDGETGLG